MPLGRIIFGRGPHVGSVKPGDGFEPQVEMTEDEFIRLITTHEIREKKDGTYICRPMGGDGRRSDSNAEEWPLFPADFDDLLPGDIERLAEWFDKQGLKAVLSTTFSHDTDHPRVRAWLFCSRDVTAGEHGVLHQALLPVFEGFKLDVCTAKPSQPLFLPACPEAKKSLAFARSFAGRPLDIDGVLAGYREVIEDRERARKHDAKAHKTGVRSLPDIEYFNRNFDEIHDLLVEHGYKSRHRNRYCAPGSKSGRAAVIYYPELQRVLSYHEPDHDPLAARDKFGNALLNDPFGVVCSLKFGGDFKATYHFAKAWAQSRGFKEEVHVAPLPPIVSELNIESGMEPRKFLVRPILERKSIYLCTGDSNAGKSTVLQYLAHCIVRGIPFGPCEVPHNGRVLWIAGEDSYNSRLRIAGMLQYFSATRSPEYHILPGVIQVLSAESMESLHRMIEQAMGEEAEIAAFFLDSKAVLWGGEDENNNSEASQFMATLRAEMCERYGATVFLLHHLTKKSKDGSGEQSARGAGALINDADAEIRFSRSDTAGKLTMQPGAKMRGKRWDPLHFENKLLTLDQKLWPTLVDPQGYVPEINIAVPVNAFGKSLQAHQQDQKLQNLLQAIAQVCAANPAPLSINAIRIAAKGDRRTIKPLVELAVEQGLLHGETLRVTDAGVAFAKQEALIEEPEEKVGEHA
jgi:hypothetical protein